MGETNDKIIHLEKTPLIFNPTGLLLSCYPFSIFIHQAALNLNYTTTLNRINYKTNV